MSGRRDDDGAISQGRHDFTRETALEWIIPRWRAELAEMDERRRAERVALARQRAAEHPQSYLARWLRELYGVK